MTFFRRLYLRISDCDGLCYNCAGRLKLYCDEMKGKNDVTVEKIKIVYRVTRGNERAIIEHNLKSNKFESLRIRLLALSDLIEQGIKKIKQND